ncbi:hypothetical protein, partial [Ruminococcus sp.]|uniref:hypothetical protein n=1 Tax=Ruminococcus sp. TaxID=41978 RepID=UPI0039A30057
QLAHFFISEVAQFFIDKGTSGTRMSMATMILRCAAIATITATPDAAVVMRYYMRTMPTI